VIVAANAMVEVVVFVVHTCGMSAEGKAVMLVVMVIDDVYGRKTDSCVENGGRGLMAKMVIMVLYYNGFVIVCDGGGISINVFRCDTYVGYCDCGTDVSGHCNRNGVDDFCGDNSVTGSITIVTTMV
jgi:hypothetical protein